jgi:hypothetical protein
MVVQRPFIPQWSEYPNFGPKTIMPFFHAKQVKTYIFFVRNGKNYYYLGKSFFYPIGIFFE